MIGLHRGFEEHGPDDAAIVDQRDDGVDQRHNYQYCEQLTHHCLALADQRLALPPGGYKDKYLTDEAGQRWNTCQGEQAEGRTSTQQRRAAE